MTILWKIGFAAALYAVGVGVTWVLCKPRRDDDVAEILGKAMLALFWWLAWPLAFILDRLDSRFPGRRRR